jgi:hypothetical protein
MQTKLSDESIIFISDVGKKNCNSRQTILVNSRQTIFFISTFLWSLKKRNVSLAIFELFRKDSLVEDYVNEDSHVPLAD